VAVAMRRWAQLSDTINQRRNVSPVTLFSGVSADVLHCVLLPENAMALRTAIGAVHHSHD
jgi:hypothetical protein